MNHCGNCGAAWQPGARFCGACGSPATPAPTSEEQPPPPEEWNETRPLTHDLGSEPPAMPGPAPSVDAPTPAAYGAPLPPPPAVPAAAAGVPAAPVVTGPSDPGVTSVAAPAPTAALPQWPRFDITQILTGDWLGAAVTALVTLLTAFAASALLVALMHPDGVSVKGFLTVVTIVTGSAFGGDAAGHVNVGDAEVWSVGAYPLTVTALALTAGGALLCRQLRRYPDWTGAAIHAIRTALVFVAGMVVLTLVFRASIRVPGTFGNVGHASEDTTGFALASGRWASHSAASAALGATWLLVIAIGAIVMRGPTLPSPVLRVRAWLAGPLRSLAIVFLGATLLGVFSVVLLFVKDDTTHNTSTIAIWLAVLPNIGITTLYTGAGAGLHNVIRSGTFDQTTTRHLPYFGDHVSNWLWALPVGTLLVIGGSALYVAYRSTPDRIQADMLRWLVAFVVATPILVHLAAYHAGFESGPRLRQRATVTVGIDSWQAIGLALAWSFAVALVITGVARARTQRPTQVPPPAWANQQQ